MSNICVKEWKQSKVLKNLQHITVYIASIATEEYLAPFSVIRQVYCSQSSLHPLFSNTCSMCCQVSSHHSTTKCGTNL